MNKPFSFFLVTDTHFFDESFKRTGSAYENRSKTDQKCVAETPAIIDAGFEQLASDTDCDVILIPGDLVYRGEYQSHVGFRNRLYKLKEQGKRIYITTARHDYAGDPVEFDGDNLVPVKGMEREELREFYKDFGFSQALGEHRQTMSYSVQLAEHVRLLALNCDGDMKNFRGLYDDQMQWALEEIKKAHEAGDYIFAIMHYPLLPFSPVMNLIDDAKITDWEKRAAEFTDSGLDLIFTGHMHAQAITEFTSKNGNVITDVQTGCFVGCPCAYRKVTLDKSTAFVTSYTIHDFDYDKHGLNAEEYFKWRFDRMINGEIDKILPEKAVKILNKMTVKTLARLTFVRVDKSIEDIPVRNLAVEIVRNVFVGNEPYTKGTPVYNAVDRVLTRLHPVLSVLEKKLGKKQPLLGDIKSFVLSSIGDEKQRDYEAEIEIDKLGFLGGNNK